MPTSTVLLIVPEYLCPMHVTSGSRQDLLVSIDIGDIPREELNDPSHPLHSLAIIFDDRAGPDGVDPIRDTKFEGSKEQLTFLGGRGADWCWGGAGDDQLFMGAEADVGFGGAGSDVIAGRSGDDHLDGGFHADLLLGDGGDDLLFGSHGGDDLRGGGGDDFLSGGLGMDRLEGNQGADLYIGGEKADAFICRPDEGDRVLDFALDQNDTLSVVIDGVEQDVTAEADRWLTPEGFVVTPPPAPAPAPVAVAEVPASDGGTT